MKCGDCGKREEEKIKGASGQPAYSTLVHRREHSEKEKRHHTKDPDRTKGDTRKASTVRAGLDLFRLPFRQLMGGKRKC